MSKRAAARIEPPGQDGEEAKKAAIEEALRRAEISKGIPHEEVAEWLASLGGAKAKLRPKPPV
jgi:predicted transcriptional regulator